MSLGVYPFKEGLSCLRKQKKIFTELSPFGKMVDKHGAVPIHPTASKLIMTCVVIIGYIFVFIQMELLNLLKIKRYVLLKYQSEPK